MLDKVYPAIREKMWYMDTVKIQIDGARPHTKKSIQKELVTSGESVVPRILLLLQPPQSPDANVLDLETFSSIDKAIGPNRSTNIMEFVSQVENTFKDYESEKLTNIYRTLTYCVEEIYNCGGDNIYKLPHGPKPPWNRVYMNS